ncbi:MAG: sigma 54-interacting response regulator [Chitinophagaceae bacterium]
MDTPHKILIVEDQFVEANHLRLMLNKAGYEVQPVARSVREAIELISKERPALVLVDIFLSGKETGIDLARYLKKEQIGFIYLSANSNEDILNEAKATHPFGFLIKPFRERDLLVTMEIAAYHQEYGRESGLRKETFFQRQLLALKKSDGDHPTKMLKLVQALQPLIPYDLAVAVRKTARNDLNELTAFLRTGYDQYNVIGVEEFQLATKLKTHELRQRLEQVSPEANVTLYTNAAFEKATQSSGMKEAIKHHYGMRSNLVVPIWEATDGSVFYFSFFSRQPAGFDPDHVDLCERLRYSLLTIVQSMDNPSIEPVVASNAEKDNVPVARLAGIVGTSAPIMQVFDLLMQVASAETSVLITGESGTGKESIADNIHRLSHRKNGPLVKVNCGALPSSLIESELFGHEKGAFTGATERRIGKFEQAGNGTIFLDEIGEMPLEMQSRLLRVLQQKEIERVGGKETIRINARVVAATNRNLEKEVAEGRFRLDLYYRLNVFPIHLPALRERQEDIPLLANHFLKLYAEQNQKKIVRLTGDALHSLQNYTWPGNIRELENVIERSVLTTKGTEISGIVLPSAINSIPATTQAEHDRTIEENEREHILRVLRKCNGRIRGSGGAAEILGVPPTTLASKIKKLGIKKDFFSTS